MERGKKFLLEVVPMREKLFWDREKQMLSPEIEIERAINFGGFEFIEEVQKKHGMTTFAEVLMRNKNLSKKAVNYWCLVLGIKRTKTYTFQNTVTIWMPFR